MKKTLSILIVMLAFVLISCSPNIKSPENEIPNQETTESEDTDHGQIAEDKDKGKGNQHHAIVFHIILQVS